MTDERSAPSNPASVTDAVPGRTPLRKLELICTEIYERWDKDQRSGKLLSALAGMNPSYRADVDEVRAALNAADGMAEALEKIITKDQHIVYRVDDEKQTSEMSHMAHGQFAEIAHSALAAYRAARTGGGK
jgi:hypothetical protein